MAEKGYTRYATSYKNAIKDKKFYIQPFKGNQINLGDFYLLHNGNLDKEYLCALFDIDIKEKIKTLNDTQILVKIIEKCDLDDWSEKY